jgi:hypothetical protein
MRGGRVSGRIRDLRFSTDPVPGSFFKSVGLDYINISYPFGLLGIIEKRYPSGAGRLVGLRFGPEAAQLETSLAAVLALLHGPDDLDERA